LHIVEKLCEAAHEKVNHRYSKRDDECERSLRKAICIWYKNRFDVDLDPETEVVPLIGSKEGIAHLSTAFLNPDDIALVPSPAYPVHFNGVIMAGGILYNLPLLRENDYLPILDTIPAEVLSRSKLMFLSYPHNPTAAVADRSFYEKIVKWIRGKDIILASDAAYSDITYDGHEPTSILQIEGAKDVAIEFHTLSKSYNMAGWRLGFAVGNASILSSLEKTKSYTDFGIFRPIQHAAIEALTGDQSSVTDLVARYKERMDCFIDGLHAMGWKVPRPKATFYVWAYLPEKYSALSSLDFSSLMLREIGVATAPGTGFGEYGEGYVRFALVVDLPLLEEALVRIKEFISI
jgi:LL-diaminopimelate aminotransferase